MQCMYPSQKGAIAEKEKKLKELQRKNDAQRIELMR